MKKAQIINILGCVFLIIGNFIPVFIYDEIKYIGKGTSFLDPYRFSETLTNTITLSELNILFFILLIILALGSFMLSFLKTSGDTQIFLGSIALILIVFLFFQEYRENYRFFWGTAFLLVGSVMIISSGLILKKSFS